MSHAETRAALLRLAAEHRHISNLTIKRSLDLLSFLEIEELVIEGIGADDWGAITFSFASAALPQIAVRGHDLTACCEDADDPVARLVNAITSAYEADGLDEDDDEDELDD